MKVPKRINILRSNLVHQTFSEEKRGGNKEEGINIYYKCSEMFGKELGYIIRWMYTAIMYTLEEVCGGNGSGQCPEARGCGSQLLKDTRR